MLFNVIVYFEEECQLIDESEGSPTNQWIEKQVLGKHGKELVTSLPYWVIVMAC